jgi:pimeloyl-ACP methyl ester carboxylesterase
MPEPSVTIVLVHGAFTDASVWHGVIAELQQRGYHAVAPAMPMRGLASDVAYLHSILMCIEGPVILAGHSYGGSVISQPDALSPAVRGVVFVAAFQQAAGETAGELNYRFPGSKITPDVTVVCEYPGGNDMYLAPEHFAEIYAADLDPALSKVMAVAQHPIDPTVLDETFSGVASWAFLPSWALVATADESIPTECQRFMVTRAGSTIVEVNSSHAVPIAHPIETADVIVEAVLAVA